MSALDDLIARDTGQAKSSGSALDALITSDLGSRGSTGTRISLDNMAPDAGAGRGFINPSEPPDSLTSSITQGAGNMLAGAFRGAGSIGATLLSPVDMAARAVNGGKPINVGGFDIAGQDRRTGMDSGLQSMGAEPDSWMYKGGKIGAEVAGSAGVGGVLAKGLQAIPMLAKFAPVVQSGGLTLGPGITGGYAANLATRAAGGAINGAATASLIDPSTSNAVDGAIAGGALPVAIKGAQYAGKAVQGIAKNVLGGSTGTSAETIGAAFNAGQNNSQSFLQNMRGEVPFDDVVTSAKAGLSNMRADRGAQYRSGMLDISADKSVLNFAPIDSALQNVQQMGSYKGVQINKNASGVVDDLSNTISQWRGLDPAEYHTPEGMDALKRSIGDIRDATQFGTPARKAADTVYNSVKTEITNQAPTYSKVMGDYSAASDQLSQVEKALSLGDKASNDTAIRKLQSLMRNNAQTNYGSRLSLANQLEQNGGVDLIPSIAGQALNSWMPRGMTGAIQKAGGTAAIGAGLLNPAFLAPLAMAPFASPRLMGETAFRAGLLTNTIGNAGSSAAQGLLSANPNMQQIGRGLLTTLPVAISANQTAPR